MSSEKVTFSNGFEMPIVGLGTWMADDPEALEAALEEALEAGYRYIDTAFAYFNEGVIGNVLKRWLDEGRVAREELFIVTKLPMNGMSPERVNYFLKKSLASLQLDYVDLYLIHVPFGIKYTVDDYRKEPPTESGEPDFELESTLEGVWGVMEGQVDAGLARSIGVCNFNCEQIDRIVSVARIQPANVQIEMSVYCQRKDIVETCAKYGVTLCAYSPLGSPGNKASFGEFGVEFPCLNMLEDPVVGEISEAQEKTPAQILLKFLVQQNVVVIPKSVTGERIRQNIDLFDFQLSDDEMDLLHSLDRGNQGRVVFTTASFNCGWEAHPEWPFPK